MEQDSRWPFDRLRNVFKTRIETTSTMGPKPVIVHLNATARLASLERQHGPPRSPNSRLPAPTSFAFLNLMSAIDSQDIQRALDAIGEICAKSSLSLANAHEAHRPPLGEITTRPRLTKTLTSVPEVNSSSEGLSPREELDLMDDRSSQWLDPAAISRQISLSSIPGLAKLKVYCKPVVGLSSLAAIDDTPLQR